MVSAHNKTFFFFSRALNKKKERNTCDALWWKLYEFSNESPTRDVLFYHPPSCRWSKTCVWEINPADFIKQKQKNSRKVFGSRSADETTHVFPLSCVFVSTQPLSISNTWLIADSTLQRNHRIIQFECENRPLSVVLRPCVVSPADTSQSSGRFLTWSTVFTPTPPCHVPHVYLLRGCLKWLSYLKPVFWWAEYKDVLRNIFITVLTESRGSNMKEDVEELSWYLIVRVNEATSGFLHLRGSVFLHNSPFFSRCSFLKTHVMMSLDSDLT